MFYAPLMHRLNGCSETVSSLPLQLIDLSYLRGSFRVPSDELNYQLAYDCCMRRVTFCMFSSAVNSVLQNYAARSKACQVWKESEEPHTCCMLHIYKI